MGEKMLQRDGEDWGSSQGKGSHLSFCAWPRPSCLEFAQSNDPTCADTLKYFCPRHEAMARAQGQTGERPQEKETTPFNTDPPAPPGEGVAVKHPMRGKDLKLRRPAEKPAAAAGAGGGEPADRRPVFAVSLAGQLLGEWRGVPSAAEALGVDRAVLEGAMRRGEIFQGRRFVREAPPPTPLLKQETPCAPPSPDAPRNTAASPSPTSASLPGPTVLPPAGSGPGSMPAATAPAPPASGAPPCTPPTPASLNDSTRTSRASPSPRTSPRSSRPPRNPSPSAPPLPAGSPTGLMLDPASGEPSGGNSRGRRKIRSVDRIAPDGTVTEFGSTRDAAAAENVTTGAIWHAIAGGTRTRSGHAWRWGTRERYNLPPGKDRDSKGTICRAVIRVELGEDGAEQLQTYPSARAAAESLGVSSGAIHAVLNGRNQTAAGFGWRWGPAVRVRLTRPPAASGGSIDQSFQENAMPRRRIECLDDGKIFDTAAYAAAYAGVAVQTLRAALAPCSKFHIAGGKRWRWIEGPADALAKREPPDPHPPLETLAIASGSLAIGDVQAPSLSHALAALAGMAIGHGGMTVSGMRITMPGQVELSIEKLELAARNSSGGAS